MKKFLAIIKNGIIDENPVLRLVLGTCSTLALTTSASTAIGMGAAATFVLIGSNMAISALRKVIPDKVRIPAFITVIAGFVSIIEMLMRAFMPGLYEALGVFLPLIVVNCIILGRAEMYACKHTVVESMFDGIGEGIGFTAILLIMSSIREVLGAGTWFGMRIFPEEYAIGVLTKAPGGFFVFGCLIAALAVLMNKKKIRVVKSDRTMGCGHNCADCLELGCEGDKK